MAPGRPRGPYSEISVGDIRIRGHAEAYQSRSGSQANAQFLRKLTSRSLTRCDRSRMEEECSMRSYCDDCGRDRILLILISRPSDVLLGARLGRGQGIAIATSWQDTLHRSCARAPTEEIMLSIGVANGCTRKRWAMVCGCRNSAIRGQAPGPQPASAPFAPSIASFIVAGRCKSQNDSCM
jgi:hypothetical protein